MKVIIVIPARYGSKRFPGKPLAVLEGKPILQRVWDIARRACQELPDCRAVVATETPSPTSKSGEIVKFCETRGIPVVVTSDSCHSGSDRVWEVVSNLPERPEVIVNLQGDVPTCPPKFVVDLANALLAAPDASVGSIYTRLTWEALDALREAKKTSPFSGTTLILNKNSEAVWFSKNIVPAIRDEEKRRAESEYSPVNRHVGLYAYRYDALKFFANAEKSEYERLEQLEQLRFLENGYSIKMVEGTYPPGYERSASGVDSPEDLERVGRIIREYGELLD